MRKNRLFYRATALLLAAVLSVGMTAGGTGSMEAYGAADKLLTLSMAKRSGLVNSQECEKLESELNVKEVSLKQAVKSIQLKQKNMSTFRWTPLLSFKFPEKPDLSEAYEFQFKPIQIQAEIDEVKHKLTDQKLAVYEKISKLYVDVVVLEERIDFREQRLKTQQDTLKKNRAKLKLGQATQNDIDTMEKSIKALTEKIASDERSLASTKKKLSTAIGMDVTTGYRFENPLVSAEIPRSQLKSLVEYTLDRDESYYEASMDATTSLTSLRTNYKLMEGQYGSKMSYISSFVNQAIAGQKIDGKAFKNKYEQFLVAIDAPWQGKKKILFIRIPKEWFKGQISGIRYVEDEPYALYEAALEYQDVLKEKENTKQTVTQNVEDGYENLINLRNAYLSLETQKTEEEKNLKADAVRNRLGELTYEEYKSAQDDYEGIQEDLFEAMASYSEALYSFDRLTCGGITAYLGETGVSLTAGSGGESVVTEEYAEGATYYIEPIIQEQQFRVGVHIPADFELEITDFELWCDQVQIGKRTPVDQPIRHMSLTTDQVSEVKLRFYNQGEFVDDCIIDPDSLSGPLNIVKGYRTDTTENLEVGSYTMEADSLTGMTTIQLTVNETEGVKAYRIRTQDGKYLAGNTPIAIERKFRYLSLIQDSLGDLVIEFFGENSDLKYQGYFDTTNRKLMKNPEGT